MKVSITVPEALSEISVYQYQKYQKLIDGQDNVDFINQKAVEVFCNIRINDIRAIKVADYNEILSDIAQMFGSQTPLVHRFKMGGQEFGFIPDLDNVSLGEYIDLETYLSDPELYHKAMAVMYRPVVYSKRDMYTIEDYETADKYAEQMKSAPLDALLGAQIFFYNLGKELVRHTLGSSELGMMNQELQRALKENGVGMEAFMHWLAEGWNGLMPSLN
jgi:hypothetical protein